jgi:hypothetical protein
MGQVSDDWRCYRYNVFMGSGFRCQVAGNGERRHGAWGIDSLKFNLDLMLLRFALYALLYASCLETVTSDQNQVTRDQKPET